MRSALILTVAIVLVILLSFGIYRLSFGDRGAQAESVAIQDPRPGDRAGGPGMRGGLGMRGGPGMMGRPVQTIFVSSRDAFSEALALLGELNLRSDFTLTAEQKQKLQAIRDGVASAQARWRSDHEADFTKLEESLRAAREADNAGPGRQGFRDLMTQRQELLASAPKTDDALQQVKALLTPEQLQLFETQLNQRQAQLEETRRSMQDRMGGFGSGRGQRPQRPSTQPSSLGR